MQVFGNGRINWRLFPPLQEPDWAYWDECFPGGLGPSIFSAPAWQRLMCEEMKPDWRLMFLRTNGMDARCLLPVFVRKGHWGRMEITVRPVAYYVTPINAELLNESMIQRVILAPQTPFTAGFTWWLPPWSPWQALVIPGTCPLGSVDWSFGETYVIPLRGSVAEHLETQVSRMHTRHIRTSYHRGLEIIDSPSEDLIDEYYQLYARVRVEEQWIGPQFTPSFFHGVATTLRDGGRLLVMQYKGRVVGGGVLLFDHQAVHYFQGTIDRRIKEVFPHPVLYAVALKYAEAQGLSHVNLGGVNAGNQGLLRFKQSWGAIACTVPVVRWRFDGPPLARQISRGLCRLMKGDTRWKRT
jgi:hypothetical protein